MKSAQRLLAIILVLTMLLADGSMAALADAVLTMPAALQIIEEEAFYGSTSIDKVVLSDNVTEIRSKAFANSTLSEISLPDSLTFIAEDAFDGPNKVTITVNSGTYAYDWAFDHGYISGELAIASITTDRDEVAVGESVTWTTVATGGTEPYRYQFALYKESTRIKQSSYSTSNTFTYTFEEVGTYHLIGRVRDGDYTVVEETLANFEVTNPEFEFGVTLTTDVESAYLHDTIVWTAEAHGGAEPYRYAFTLFIDGKQSSKQAYSTDNTYVVTAEKAADYTVQVDVLDADNNGCTYTSDPFSVLLAELKVEAINGSDEAQTEDEVYWYTEISGGQEPYTYAYTLTLGTKEVESTEASEDSSFTATLMETGTYKLNVLVTDVLGHTATGTTQCKVTLRPVAVKSIDYESETYMTDDPITWTVEAEGGDRNYTYAFTVYQDEEEEVDFRSFSADNTFTYTPEVAGTYYVEVTVRDSAKRSAIETGGYITISAHPLEIKSVTPDEEIVKIGNSVTMTAEAVGGVAPLRYSYEVYSNGTLVKASAYSLGSTYTYKATESGGYTFKVKVKDSENTIQEITSNVVTFYDALSLNGITDSASSVLTGEAVTWTVDRIGGKGVITYVWYIYCNEELEFTQQNTVNSLKYAPMRSGTYTASVMAKDESDAMVEISGGAVSVSAHPSTSQNDFTFSVNDGSRCTVTSYNGTDEAVIVPAEWIDDDDIHRTVVAIGNNAFKGNKFITSVVLPDGVVYDITMGSSVFEGCTNLLYIKGGKKLINIGDRAFYGCTSLISYDFEPDTVTIGRYAFAYCTGFDHFEGWDGLKTLSNRAFLNCSSLVSVHLPDSITTMGIDVFMGCSNLSSVNYPTSWTTKSTNYNSGSEYNSSTAESPFYNCAKLTSIVVPEGVTSIPANAFYGCSSLREVSLPSTLTSIGSSAFQGCSGIISIDLPNKLTTINSSAFSGCTGLRSIFIPDSVTSIGEYAFNGCSGLTSAHVSSQISQINRYTFSGCTGLTSIDLPNGLKTLSNRAFLNCSSLVSVHLPDSITTMGIDVFMGCSNLSSVNYPTSWTTKSTNYNSGSEYNSSTAESPFYNCAKLTSIVVPEGVTSIPANAFYGCSSLKSVSLPSTLKTINNQAFYGCTGLLAINIESNVITIGTNAFYNHSSNLVIYGEAGSYVETYAINNNITFSTEYMGTTYGSLSGRVTNIEGDAIVNVSIALTQYGTDNVEFQTVSGSGGTWYIDKVPVGRRYQASYTLDGYTFSVDSPVYMATESGYKVGTVIASPVNAAALNTLNLSISSWTGSSEDAQRYFTVSTVGSWYVESTPDWATVYADEATNATIPTQRVKMVARSASLTSNVVTSTTSDAVVILENNDGLSSRKGSIVISNGTTSATVDITQLPESYEGMAVQFTYPTADTTSINLSTELTLSLEAINFKYGELTILAPDGSEEAVIEFTDAAFSYPYTFKGTGEYTVFTTIYGNDILLDVGEVARPSIQTKELKIVVTKSNATSVSVKTSADGIQLIKDYESFRATPYVDGNTTQYDENGNKLYHWSIGYGEQLDGLYSKENPPQFTMTEEEASVSLLKKLAQREKMVDGYLSKWGVTLSTAQYDAVMSFNWNFWPDSVFTDTSNFASFQRLIKKYANGGSAEAWEVYRTFVLYHHANGVDNVGLFKRRMTEANLFVTGDYNTRNWDYVALGADSWFMVPDADGIVRRGLDVPAEWYKSSTNQGLNIALTSYSYSSNGGNETVTVNGSSSWEARSDSEWIIVDKTAASYGSAVLKYKVEQSTVSNRRTGHIVVTDTQKNRSVTLTIVQEGTTATGLTVALKPINLRSGGEVKMGSLFGFNAMGSGGEGTYSYAFAIQKLNDAGVYEDYTWTSKYTSVLNGNYLALEADVYGFYRVCATVTDGNGDKAQVYDTFSVSWTEPIIYDAAFADGNFYDIDHMPTVRWEKPSNAFYYRVKIVELAQVGTSNVHYVIPVNGKASDEGLMVNTNSIALDQYTFKKSQTYRMWVGAYNPRGIRIAQSEFIFSTNPLQSIDIALQYTSTGTNSSKVPWTEDLTIAWNTIIPNSALNRDVAYLRANIKDNVDGIWLQSVKDNCAHMPADQTSFIVPEDELKPGHQYTLWLAAFTKEGARFAQGRVDFTTTDSIVIDGTEVTTNLTPTKASSSTLNYVKQTINIHISKDLKSGKYLANGKSMIFMFEGSGTSSDTTKRQYALCVVVRLNANGQPEIVYENNNCSTIPDQPKYTYTYTDVNGSPYTQDCATVPDGVYTVTETNHQGKYGALSTNASSVVRFNNGTSVDGRAATGSGFNVHGRTSSWVASGTTETANSKGCILIGISKQEQNEFMHKVLGVSGEATNTYYPTFSGSVRSVVGCIIIDRSQATSYLTSIYGSAGAALVSP